MKHLIFLILLVFVSCSGEMGADGSNNSAGTGPTLKDTVGGNGNSNNNGSGGGSSILDNFISDASAGVIEIDNGCIDGFSKFAVYSNTESYHQYGMSTCKWEQLKHAFVQGIINLNSTPFIADLGLSSYRLWFVTDTASQGYQAWTEYEQGKPTSVPEYCCYK